MKSLEKWQRRLQHPHFIFSAENPVVEPEARIATTRLASMLQAFGYVVGVIDGVYGGKAEQSLIVWLKHPDDEQALREFAKLLGQESYIKSDGTNHTMIYVNGERANKIVWGKGTEWFREEDKPEDCYSEIAKGVYFKYLFDWDTNGQFS